MVAGSQLQPPQVSELCLVTSTRSSLPAHFCSVAGQLFPVTSFERFLVAYVSNLLPNSARLYSTGDSNTLLLPSGLIQYLTLTEAGYVQVCLSWGSILGFVVEVLLLLLDNSSGFVIEKKH